MHGALGLGLVLGLAACGGGGGGGGFGSLPAATATTSSTSTSSNTGNGSSNAGANGNATGSTDGSSPVVTQLAGLAATGAPVANSAVSVRCANDASANTSTDANGKWRVGLSAPVFPCLVTVSGGGLAASQALYSLALDASDLDVTPLTGLVLASAAQAAPSTLSSASALSAASSALAQGLANINASLRASGYTPLTGDPLTISFQPVAGDAYDDLISTLVRSLSDESTGYDSLLASVASAGSGQVPIPLTHVFTTTEIAAMPAINNARMDMAVGELTMTLTGGSAPVGGYVGGGTGNKAVLQLPGMAGTKLKDFRDMTLVMESAGGSYVPYVNFFVDLHCDPSPLAQNATVADVQKRRRVVIYDPWHQFVEIGPGIPSTAYTPVTFDFTTPGWRVSAGDPLGSNLAVTDYTGTKTLQGFDFATYPDACIVDGISDDNGMFRDATADPQCAAASALPGTAPAACGKPHSGAIVVLGGSSNLDPAAYKLRKIRYGGVNARNFSFQ